MHLAQLCARENSTVSPLGQVVQVSSVPVAAFSTAAFEVYRLPAISGAISTEDDVLLGTSVFTRLTCNTGTDSHFSIPLIARSSFLAPGLKLLTRRAFLVAVEFVNLGQPWWKSCML